MHHATLFRPLAPPFLYSHSSYLSVDRIREVQLTNLQNRITQSLHSTSVTEVSSLLRTVPPLFLALVLSPSWVLHLWLFPYHPETGSQVPNQSLYQGHATSMPATIWTVNRFLPNLSRDPCTPRFR
jgi:hypothetical protein